MIQIGIHSTQNTIPGSRWPTLHSAPDAASMRMNTQVQSSLSAYSTPMAFPTTSSTARRKPKMTFRSPDATTPLALKLSTPTAPASSERNHTVWNSSGSSASSSNSLPTPSVSTASAARGTCSFFTPSPPLFKMPLAYPSYHPFSSGQLFLAAAARADAAARRRTTENGGTERDDTSLQGDDLPSNGVGRHDLGSNTRRSSSRTRRPVAKLRDVAGGEEGIVLDTAPKEDEPSRAKSPKRKRVGGGGGSRKKRKEASSAPAEAQPRRERQRRGAAAAAAAAMAENAEAVAAALDGDSTEAVEPSETPVSIDGSAVPASPEEDDKEAETAAPKNSTSTKTARAKRQPRAKRSRNASSNKTDAKEPTPTRTTRQSRRRGSSASGSEGTGTSASAPVAETPAAKEAPEDEAAPAVASMNVDDFTANIDPALLAEDASAAASTGSTVVGPRAF